MLSPHSEVFRAILLRAVHFSPQTEVIRAGFLRAVHVFTTFRGDAGRFC